MIRAETAAEDTFRQNIHDGSLRGFVMSHSTVFLMFNQLFHKLKIKRLQILLIIFKELFPTVGIVTLGLLYYPFIDNLSARCIELVGVVVHDAVVLGMIYRTPIRVVRLIVSHIPITRPADELIPVPE